MSSGKDKSRTDWWVRKRQEIEGRIRHYRVLYNNPKEKQNKNDHNETFHPDFVFPSRPCLSIPTLSFHPYLVLSLPALSFPSFSLFPIWKIMPVISNIHKSNENKGPDIKSPGKVR